MGLPLNDFFHAAKAFYPFLALYGDKIRRPRFVEEDTADALTARGSTEAVEPWYLQIFVPADADHAALKPQVVRTMTHDKLSLRRMADTSTELKKEGFNLDTRDNTGKARCARLRFPNTTNAVAVAMQYAEVRG